MPTQPKHLDYVNTQFLLIGESSGLDKAMQPSEKDQKSDREGPLEEMGKLEGEDEIRTDQLQGMCHEQLCSQAWLTG